MSLLAGTHPILTCDEARALEAGLFAGEEAKEWIAMQQAGRAIAAAVLRDFEEVGGFSRRGRLLVLVGKGHNGGDALIATQAILEQHREARAEVMFAFGERALRPLAARAWRELSGIVGDRVAVRSLSWIHGTEAERPFELCLDGIFGFQFRPPLEPPIAALFDRVNALPVRLRAAVDLPSAGVFRADFTYATGSVKTPVIDAPEAGRMRYLDLGFFRGESPGAQRVLTEAVLAPLAALRPTRCDKRTYGHVFVLGGSRSYPGAILMTVLSALRSGAGLVTAFVPESLAPSFAARAPEAMWVGWPETPAGGLALEGEHLLRERIDRATALVLGPGLTRETESRALAGSIAERSPVPLVIDADALQPEIVRAGQAPRVVTPHAGEFKRIDQPGTGGDHTVVVLKGPITRLWQGSQAPRYHSFFGGPVLARGGSGDVLAGLIGGLLAQDPGDPLLAAARGVVWHGLAADVLARAHGQVAVQTTQLLDFLPTALRESAACPAR